MAVHPFPSEDELPNYTGFPLISQNNVEVSGDFTLKVYSNFAWANHHELTLYDFAPADIPLVEKLRAVIG